MSGGSQHLELRAKRRDGAVFLAGPAQPPFEVGGEAGDGGVGRRVLGGRADQRLGESTGRPLMIGIERSQRFDRVAEQFDAYRLVRFRREDVHDAAASRDLSGALDGVDAAVSCAQAVEEKSFGSQGVPGNDRARARTDLRRRRQPR